MKEVVIIKTFSTKFIAWTCFVFFLLCTIGCIYSGQPEVSPLFICFCILGGFMLLLYGKAEISHDGFKVMIPLGTFYISWDEVEYIETGSGNLIIGGGAKRLCFPSFQFWGGKEKYKAIEIFACIVEKKQIEIKETKRAIIPIYRSTKIRKMD